MYSDVKASGMKLTLFIKHINERKHDQEHDERMKRPLSKLQETSIRSWYKLCLVKY